MMLLCVVACGGGRASRTVILTVADAVVPRDSGPVAVRLRLHQAMAVSRPGDGLESWLQTTTAGPDAAMSIAAVQPSSGMSAVTAGAIVPANDARQSSAAHESRSVTSNKGDQQERHHTSDHAGHGALPAVSSEGHLRRLRWSALSLLRSIGCARAMSSSVITGAGLGAGAFSERCRARPDTACSDDSRAHQETSPLARGETPDCARPRSRPHLHGAPSTGAAAPVAARRARQAPK